MKRRLEHIEIPGEHDARTRSWEVVRTAYTEREPVARRTPFLRPLLAAAVVAALVAAALSPPGRAVVDSVRKAIGVESADEALFALPAPGRVLVSSDSGVWVVSADGSKRRLGDYREASWSPFGRFVVAAREHELATLEPDGDLHWKLARPEVRLPRWGGSRIDTRIAYLSGGAVRVVAGDGKDDRVLVARGAAEVAPAWRPGPGHVLAVATEDGVSAIDTTSGKTLWRAKDVRAQSLTWSADASRLLALTSQGYTLLTGGGRVLEQPQLRVAQAAYSPRGDSLALLRRTARGSELLVDGRRRFAGTGTFEQLAWSPDGRWVLVTWREPDQWLFVSASGARAVANVSRQFESRTFPRLEGWAAP